MTGARAAAGAADQHIASDTVASAIRSAADGRSGSISPAVLAGAVRLLDAACVLAGLALLWSYAMDNLALRPHLHLASLIGAVLILAGLARGGYTPRALREGALQLRVVMGSLILGLSGAIGGLLVLQDGNPFTHRWLWAWFAATAALLTVWRFGLHAIFRIADRAGVLRRRIAVVGTPDLAGRFVAQAIAAHADWHVIGLYDDDDGGGPNATKAGAGCADRLRADTLVERCRQARAEAIVLAVPLTEPERIAGLKRRLAALAVDLYLLADFGFVGTDHLGFADAADGAALLLQRRPLSDWEAIQKRVFDLVLASALVVALSPLMAAIAVAVRLTSPGPVLFRQPRIGLNHRMVEVLKFRSMYDNCADLLADAQTTLGDPRVTPIGRWLRRFSLDELPQLFNVLGGSMSLVGPRPHAPNTKAAGLLFPDVVAEYALRHRVKPGITGWAQVNGWRGETRTIKQIEGRVVHDLYYIENWSLLLDAKIVLKTALGGFSGPKAY
jgi:Undecaprenyl-phosphate glucose phosphotransferase